MIVFARLSYPAVTRAAVLTFLVACFPAVASAALVAGDDEKNGVTAPATPSDVPCRQVGDALAVDVRCALLLATNRNLDILDQQLSLRAAGRREWLARRDFAVKFVPEGRASTASGTAPVDPTVPATAAVSESWRAGIGLSKRFQTGTAISAEPFHEDAAGFKSNGLSVSASQALLRGILPSYNRANLDSSISQNRSAAWIREQQLASTLVGIVEQLLTLWETGERLAIYEEALKAFETKVRATEARQRVGLATSIDVYRVQIERTAIRDQLESATEQLGLALDRFRFSLNLPPEETLRPTVPEAAVVPTFDLEKEVTVAEARRADVRLAEENLNEAKRRLRLARHALLPDLALQVGFEYRNYTASPSITPLGSSSQWLFSFRTSADVSRDVERANVQDALDQVAMAERNLLRTRQRVRDDVRMALRSLERARKQEAIQREQIRQASAKLSVAEAKFRNGLANNFDLLEAEVELRNARMTLLGARREVLAGVHRVMNSRGTYLDWILETYGIDTRGL